MAAAYGREGRLPALRDLDVAFAGLLMDQLVGMFLGGGRVGKRLGVGLAGGTPADAFLKFLWKVIYAARRSMLGPSFNAKRHGRLLRLAVPIIRSL